MGGAEAVEEVQEGNAALNGGQMGHGAQVHDLLRVGGAQHGKAGLAAGHNVGVVAEDGQRVGGQARAETWMTPGSSSPAILYMLGIISSRPWEAV